MPERRPDAQLRVLVVAPIGRDGEVTLQVLTGAGIPALRCADMNEVAREVAAGAGAVLVTVDALGAAEARRLDGLLRGQEPWSTSPSCSPSTATSPSGRSRRSRGWSVPGRSPCSSAPFAS